MNSLSRRTAATLALAAVLLYAPLIGWGVPEANAPDRTKTFATDEIVPLEGLAEMHNTFVVSKPDRNYGYPWWHYFVLAAAQSPYLAYAKVTGGLTAPAPEYPFGFRDPVAGLRWLSLAGRAVSVVMAAGVVVAAFLFAETLWGYAAGLMTALLTLFNYLMFYYSRTGNLDMPVTFWSSVGLAIYAVVLMRGWTFSRAVWLGVFAGLATATKDQAALIFVPLGVALLFFNRAWKPLVTGFVSSVAAYVIGTGMLFDPQRHITHVTALLFRPNTLNTMGFYRPGYPATWSGRLQVIADFIQGSVWTYSLPVVLFMLAGAVIAWRKSPRLLIFLAPVPMLLVGLDLPAHGVTLRYYLPLVVPVCGFAAFALAELRASRLAAATIPAAILLFGWEAAIAADLTYAQYRETRIAAGGWLNGHARAGDRVEYFGVRESMPALPASIETRRIAGRTAWKKEAGHGPRMLEYLSAQGPEFLFISPDVTSKPGVPYSGDCPREVYEALLGGKTNYMQTAYFPTTTLLPSWFRRPRLDYPTVSPPLRLFARKDILARLEQHP